MLLFHNSVSRLPVTVNVEAGALCVHVTIRHWLQTAGGHLENFQYSLLDLTPPSFPRNLPRHTIQNHLIMWRRALVASAKACAQPALRTQAPAARRSLAPVVRPAVKYAPRACFQSFQSLRCYSAAVGLSKEEVEGRIMDILKNFDKVSAACNGTDGRPRR